MKKELKKIIKKDLFRYGGGYISKNIFYPQVRYFINFRKLQYYIKNNKKIFIIIYKFKLRFFSHKYHFQIGINAKIGEGFYIGHFGRIIINENVSIGKNCNIATGVTIGQESRGKKVGTPKIGNEVWIGTNAVIVGHIKIGNNVLIAPNSYVNFDVENNSIVIGNPAKVIHNEEATKFYINNKV